MANAFQWRRSKIMCLVARREANDYVLNETAIQHAGQEKTFGSHCGKNMETISPVQNSRKGKSRRGSCGSCIMLRQGALFLSSPCVVDVFTLITKAGIPFSWARSPCIQKESPCSEVFRVEISKMPEVLKGESLVVPLGAQGPLGHPEPEEGSPSVSSTLGMANQPRQPAGSGRAHSSAPPGSLCPQGERAGCSLTSPQPEGWGHYCHDLSSHPPRTT